MAKIGVNGSILSYFSPIPPPVPNRLELLFSPNWQF